MTQQLDSSVREALAHSTAPAIVRESWALYRLLYGHHPGAALREAARVLAARS